MIDAVTSTLGVTQVLRGDPCNNTSVTHTFLPSPYLPKYMRTCFLRCPLSEAIESCQDCCLLKARNLIYIFLDTLDKLNRLRIETNLRSLSYVSGSLTSLSSIDQKSDQVTNLIWFFCSLSLGCHETGFSACDDLIQSC